MNALVDRQGCLTEAGFRVLESAPPGRGPQELASHLAACGRCQQRLLSGSREGAAARPPVRARPGRSLGLGLALAAFGLLLALAALLTARWLGGS